MSKFILAFSCMLSLFSVNAYSHTNEDICCGYYLDANIAYFRPNASVLREIYSSAWAYGQVNFDATISNNGWCNSNLLFWSAVGFTYREGVTDLGSDTCFRMVPFTLGGKINFCSCNWEYYAGLGIRFFFTETTDCSGYVNDDIQKTTFGGAATIGTRYLFSRCLYFHGFIDYSFKANVVQPDQQVPFIEGSCTDVGGLAIGVGIGTKF